MQSSYSIKENWSGAAARDANAELLHARLQSGALHAEARGSPMLSCHDPMALLQGGENLLSLGVIEQGSNIPTAAGGGLQQRLRRRYGGQVVRHTQLVALHL